MPVLDKEKKTHLWADEQLMDIYLRRNKKVSEEEAASLYAKEIGLPYLDLSIFPTDQENVGFIEKAKAQELNLAVIRKAGKFLRVKTLNPEDPTMINFLEEIGRDREIGRAHV